MLLKGPYHHTAPKYMFQFSFDFIYHIWLQKHNTLKKKAAKKVLNDDNVKNIDHKLSDRGGRAF